MIDARYDFAVNYEISPIVLVGGIASGLPGGAMSILSLTEGSDNVSYEDLDRYFARFTVLSNGTLQDWGIADYPFASMVMAANAVIQNPLRVSLMMLCPAKNIGDRNYMTKIAKITAMKSKLNDHVSRGGYFHVSTPAYTYTDCLLTSIRDVSSANDKQVQLMYQWDFVQPLITQSAAAQALNNLTNRFDKQLPTPNPINNSGLDVVINNPTNTQPSPPQTPTNQ
jgi:hypothetical protein